jgi:hypothetical protein
MCATTVQFQETLDRKFVVVVVGAGAGRVNYLQQAWPRTPKLVVPEV